MAAFSGPVYASSSKSQNCAGAWAWKTSPEPRSWRAIAASSDNRRLIASTNDGLIYSSSDYGSTWINRTPEGTNPSISQWTSLVSSRDGRNIVAVDFLGGSSQQGVYTSNDFGKSWKLRTLTLEPAYWDIATQSDDGSRLVVGDMSGNIYYSRNNGVNWTKSSYSGQPIFSMTSSSNGRNLAAVVNGGYVITSRDYGANWTQQSATTNLLLNPDIAGSSDGSHLITSSYGPEGKIYTSNDFGVSWAERQTAGSRFWSSVASNGDGSRLVAASSSAKNFFDFGEVSGSLFISIDFGLNWSEIGSAGSRFWNNVVISKDGVRMIASVLEGDLYIGTDSRRR